MRGHWSVESMHWHLDVTFREDANTTIDKMAAQNFEYHKEMEPEYFETGRTNKT